MIRIVRVLLVIALLASTAQAATFTVDDAGTSADVTPGDGACLTASATCTLTAAIMESEALPGPISPPRSEKAAIRHLRAGSVRGFA